MQSYLLHVILCFTFFERGHSTQRQRFFPAIELEFVPAGKGLEKIGRLTARPAALSLTNCFPSSLKKILRLYKMPFI